jgi:hypothetical protein
MSGAGAGVFYVLWIAYGIAITWICHNMATRRNRSGTFGILMGLFLGLFGALIIWGIGPKTDAKRELEEAL